MILLTAMPRMGKSTAIKKIAKAIGMENCIGFYSEEIRVEGERVGFQVITFSGNSEVFAHVDLESNIRCGRYGVNLALMEEIILTELKNALADTYGKLVVIDEIGPMQMYSEEYKKLLVKLAESGKIVIGTIFFKPYPWIDEFKQREDVELIQLTYENRDDVVVKLVDLIKQGESIRQWG